MFKRDVMVLCYHAVSPTWEAALSIPPAALDAQIGYLVSQGWRSETFSEAVLGAAPGKILSVTFDDAFASVKQQALPILRRRGVVATVFAPTAFMDGHVALDWAGVDHWKHTSDAHEMRAMDWDDLAELVDEGWEVGSHTCTHPHLTRLDDAALTRELHESWQLCTQRLGRPCRSIAYPYGDVDARVAAAADSAGYETGARLSKDLRAQGPLLFPRVGIYHPDDWRRFRVKVAGPVRLLRATSLA